MAVRRYEISRRVLKIFHSLAALTREIFSTREEKFRISKRPYCINTNEIQNHFC